MSALVLWSLAAVLTRRRGSRKLLLSFAAGAPFACLVFAACVFVVTSFINLAFLDRDIGIGDTWQCPVPGGYSIMMIDETSQGRLSPMGPGGPSIGGVRKLQINGDYIVGGTDTQWFEHLGSNEMNTDSYFLLNAKTGQLITYATFDELTRETGKLGLNVNLERIIDVYLRHRPTIVDHAGAVFAVTPPLLSVLILGGWILRVRRRPVAALANQ